MGSFSARNERNKGLKIAVSGARFQNSGRSRRENQPLNGK
jgi:hypothetical protein